VDRTSGMHRVGTSIPRSSPPYHRPGNYLMITGIVRERYKSLPRCKGSYALGVLDLGVRLAPELRRAITSHASAVSPPEMIWPLKKSP
jgi:hypothetical protein